ncbi:MAG: 4-(cytidine 5'-diphospho)-2-C-methyl-D-erythritol kinase [Candidatus Moraniibacteriota bacterium]
MNAIKIKSPAKINLTLEVIKKLPNGFHELRTVILKLENLYDEIELRIEEKKGPIKIVCANRAVPTDERNTCYQVAEKFLKLSGKVASLEIKIKKNIPVTAGMGGGSSNGATILMALNDYFQKPLSFAKLVSIAAEVGKDIPVFLAKERVVFVSGMGEKLKNIKCNPRLNLLIINPGFPVSTAWSFEELDKNFSKMADKRRKNISLNFLKYLNGKNLDLISGKLYNDFEVAVEKKHPIIKRIKQELLAFGALGAMMSGAGPTIFGIFRTKKETLLTAKILKEYYPELFIEVA